MMCEQQAWLAKLRGIDGRIGALCVLNVIEHVVWF